MAESDPPDPPNGQRFLTVQEYADLLRVDPLTVYRRIWKGKQKGVHREGRCIRIDIAVALLGDNLKP